LVSVLLVACFAGCGGAPATVEGTVTLDGQPLAGADVTFQPTFEGGLPAYGLTDGSGHYVLNMSMNESGAMAGEHEVRISMAPTAGMDEMDGGGDEAAGERPATLPEKYNLESELKETVKPGPNTIDFALESEP
jgi:hypothetical protein